MSEIRQVDVFVHGTAESMIEKGMAIGLSEKALEYFRFTAYEVKLTLDVNMETGGSEIIAVDDKSVIGQNTIKLQENYAKLRAAMLALVGCEESELEQMVVNLRMLIAKDVAPSSDIVPSINAVEALIETRGK